MDGNGWKEAQYGQGDNGSIYINWSIKLDSNELGFTGDHTLLVRAVGEMGSYSISDNQVFFAQGSSSAIEADRLAALIVILGSIVLILAVTAYRKNFFKQE